MDQTKGKPPEKRSGWKTLAWICGGTIVVAAVVETGAKLVDPEGYERAKIERARSGGIGYGSNHVGADPAEDGVDESTTDQPLELPAIDYRQIQNAYKANEIAAERRYGDLAMRVTGPVRKVNSTLTGKATIWLGDDTDFLGTMVNLDREHTDWAARLIPGLEIELECSGAQSTLGTVSLQECRPAT